MMKKKAKKAKKMNKIKKVEMTKNAFLKNRRKNF